MAPFRAHEVYAEQLGQLSHGLPLWFPEPEPERGALQIGDVGLAVDGQFVRLFNVIEGHREELVPGPPEGEPPLKYDSRLRNTREAALKEGLHANGIRTNGQIDLHATANAVIIPAGAGGAYQFVTSKAVGAMILLTEPAKLDQVFCNTTFVDYMRQHHMSWYQFARGIGFDCKAEDIVLVRGTVKAANWTVAAFQQHARSGKVALNGELLPVAGAGFTLSFGQSSACQQDCRSRPLPTNTSLLSSGLATPLSRDQCVFLPVYKIKYRHIRFFLPPKIEAGAGPHELPRSDDHDDGPSGADAQIIGDPEPSSHYGPVDAILEYILRVRPDADVAIACEGDISDILGGGPWPDDFPAYLDQCQPEISVDPQTKLGTLCMKAVIQHSRARTIRNQSLADSQEDTIIADDDDDLRRRLDPLGSGEIILGRGGDAEPVRWPHVSMADPSAEEGAVASMALSPDGVHIATGMDDSIIRIWNYKTGSLSKKLNGHDDTPWSLSYSPDGTRLVSGAGDNLAIIWDVADENRGKLHELVGHDSDVWSVAFSPNGKLIASGSTDSSVRVWDAETGQPLHSFHADGSDVMQVLWTPDSERIVSCAGMGGRCWDVAAGQEVTMFTGHGGAIWCMNISADGRRLVTGSEDRTARIWNITTGEELVTLAEHTGAIWSVAFSPDGQEVVSGGYDSRVVVSDSYTGETKYVWTTDGEDGGAIIDTVAFSRAGDLVVSGGAEGNVNLYDRRSSMFVAQYKAHTDKVKSVQFSRDDLDIISSSDDGSVRVWSVVDTLRL